jgi:hypothetical protein
MALRQIPMAGGTTRTGDPAHRARDVAVSVVFVCGGFAAFVVAAVLLLAWGPEVVAPGGWASAHALALTHVLALGFVSSVAVGVLYHVAPRALGERLRVPVVGVGLWGVYVCGVGCLVTGLASGHTVWTAVGGALLAGALLGVGVHLGDVAVRTRRRYLPAVYQGVAVLALLCVAGLGTTLAVMLHVGAGASFLTILGVKVLLAIAGWLGVLVIGVSYQLVPMFTPSSARARLARVALWLLVGGVLVAVLALLLGAPAWARALCALPYAVGAVLHVVDVVRFVLRRRSSALVAVTAGQALGALLLLVGVGEGVAAMTGASPWPQLAVATALLGWTPTLIAANGVRIVPFILWQGLPAGRRPRTFAPAPDALGWTGIAAASATWILITVAFAANSGGAARLAGAALVVCAAAVAGIGLGSLRSARRIRRAA